MAKSKNEVTKRKNTTNKEKKLKEEVQEKDNLEKVKDEKIFAKGYCLKKIFIFFLIGCLLGTYYEEILNFIKTENWQTRQGLIYGPFSPIYGVGIAIFVIFLGKNNDKRNVWMTLLLAALIGGITEYMTSLIADKIFGVEFWNYKGMFLNINGRTTIPFMIGWGLGGTFLMKIVYPFISKWVEKIPFKVGNIIYYVVFVFILIDVIITYTVLGRMAMRDKGEKPYTFIGEIYDKIYDDEYLYKKFPIMRPEKSSSEN